MGGVGKTTLALKLAAELKPEFPDAQIYLDLKGVDPQPLTAAQAMAHVIRSFHPEARLPEDDAEVAGLYRTVLDGMRVLLLMDNAAGKEQVEPLIPPPTCLLLVTSRFRFALPGLVDRDLDEMSETEARDLLVRIAPRIRGAAEEIAGLCGRLPLALRLAGSALAERRSLSPSEYVRRLKRGTERFGAVDASLNLSYELLDEERRRLWRLLAVFPGSFEGQAAAAVWALDQEGSQDGLDELVRISLVDLEEEEVRYRLHDLARSFAEKLLESAESEAGQRRLAEHFLGVLDAAQTLYLQGGESILLALRTFDIEWGNIQVGHAWSTNYAQKDEVADRICREYPRAGTMILPLRQHARERIRWGELGLASARRRNDKRAESIHLVSVGRAYANLGETQRAIELFKDYLVIARETGDRRGEGSAFGCLGNCYADLGEPRRAIEFHEQWLAISRETGDRRGEGSALGNLSSSYTDLGENRRAVEFCEKAIVIFREIGDRLGEGGSLRNMGNAYIMLGEARRAIEFYEQQLAIAREMDDRLGEGGALGNLGIAYNMLGEDRRAIKFYEQQIAIAREMDDRLGESEALGNMANAYSNLGDTPSSIKFLEQRLVKAREIGNRLGESSASWNLGLIFEKEGNLALAADLMQTAIDYEHEIGHANAETDTAYLAALRARIAEQKP